MPNELRNDYLAALRRLHHHRSLSVTELLQICPHLSEEELLKGISEHRGGFIALPSIRIAYSYRLVTFSNEPAGGMPSFRFSCTHGRTTLSYADGKSHDDERSGVLFADEAIKYALDNWPGSLMLDNWADYIVISLQDPTDLDVHESPTTKANIFVCLNRTMNDLMNDFSAPGQLLLNRAIVFSTLESLEHDELKGSRYSTPLQYACAHCGGKLEGNHCAGCGNRFMDDGFRTSGFSALPSKLVTLLRESGFTFAQDPDRQPA